jgi:hypothetical protein
VGEKDLVGAGLGGGLGRGLGTGLGAGVGASVGSTVGAKEGRSVGRPVGRCVGKTVGAGVGRNVAEGRGVGACVGGKLMVGAGTGARLGVAVGSNWQKSALMRSFTASGQVSAHCPLVALNRWQSKKQFAKHMYLVGAVLEKQPKSTVKALKCFLKENKNTEGHAAVLGTNLEKKWLKEKLSLKGARKGALVIRGGQTHVAGPTQASTQV